MEPTSRHHEVETLFRALVEEHDIPRPDRVEYEPDAVLFLWDRPRLAVFVDFDGMAREAPPVVDGERRERPVTPWSRR